MMSLPVEPYKDGIPLKMAPHKDGTPQERYQLQMAPPRTVGKRAVRILLECFLVYVFPSSS